jgi:hypothetical protein
MAALKDSEKGHSANVESLEREWGALPNFDSDADGSSLSSGQSIPAGKFYNKLPMFKFDSYRRKYHVYTGNKSGSPQPGLPKGQELHIGAFQPTEHQRINPNQKYQKSTSQDPNKQRSILDLKKRKRDKPARSPTMGRDKKRLKTQPRVPKGQKNIFDKESLKIFAKNKLRLSSPNSNAKKVNGQPMKEQERETARSSQQSVWMNLKEPKVETNRGWDQRNAKFDKFETGNTAVGKFQLQFASRSCESLVGRGLTIKFNEIVKTSKGLKDFCNKERHAYEHDVKASWNWYNWKFDAPPPTFELWLQDRMPDFKRFTSKMVFSEKIDTGKMDQFSMKMFFVKKFQKNMMKVIGRSRGRDLNDRYQIEESRIIAES